MEERAEKGYCFLLKSIAKVKCSRRISTPYTMRTIVYSVIPALYRGCRNWRKLFLDLKRNPSFLAGELGKTATCL